jgi:hypothetical protein
MNTITELYEAMLSIRFEQPHWGWLALAVLVLVPLWKRLGHALANTFALGRNIRSVSWPGYLCTLLLIGMVLSFTVAMMGPTIATTEYTESYQAREFVLGIDSSGSMFAADVEGAELAKVVRAWEQDVYNRALQKREEFPTLYPNPPEKPQEVQNQEQNLQRFQLARYAAVQFVRSRMEASAEAKKKGRQGDRAGMFTFDDEPYWAWPLSSDLNITARKIEGLMSRSTGGGTNFEGPTEGNPRTGALQATVNHFRKWGAKGVKTKVMIMISDGDAGISEQRHQELVKQMKEEGLDIHIYFLVCGARTQMENTSTESLRKLMKDVNPNDASRPEFQKAVIWAGDAKAMQEAFDLINRLEASTVVGEPTTKQRPLRHQFALAGALCLALFIGACAVFRENF